MPTGWGKSVCLIAQAIASGKRALVLTSSKALMSQYVREFRYLNMVDVRGKSNYTCHATELGGEFYDGTLAKNVAEGPCQYGEECSLKILGCSYYDRIREAKYKRLVLSNYAAWISANIYTEGWGKFDLICCDEAHDVEDWVARMLAVRLPKCYCKLLGSKLPSGSNVAVWASWAAREWPIAKAAVRLEKKAVAANKRKRLTKLRTLQFLENSLLRLKSMTRDWKVFPSEHEVLFQPVWVHDFTESLLFNGAEKVVFASATLVPNTLNLLGVMDTDTEFFSYPSTFPVERRPVYYYPTVRMRYGMPEEEERQWVSVIDDWISRRLDRKGLIHTVSFARQNTLLKYSKYANLMVASSPSSVAGGGTLRANATLQKFRMSPAPCILIGPNWSTGIDLPYSQCNYTIVPKVPFADITDPLHIARSEDNPDYGFYDAGMKLTQSIGRAMRAENDTNETLITDIQFGKFMSRYKRMIPSWIWDAVQVVDNLPEPINV